MTTKSMMVRVGADTGEMERGLKSAQSKMQKFSSDIKKIGRGMAVAGAAITGAIGLIVKGYVKAGDEVHKMALRTGFSTKALSELRYASQICGADLGALEKGVKRMSKTINDATKAGGAMATYVRAFDQLGLKAEDLIELSPEDQFDRIARAIASVENPTIRAARAQDIFGRAGTQLLPLFAEGEAGLEKLRAKAHELGIVFDQEAANKAAKLNDSVTTLKASFKGVSMSIASILVPVITSIVEKVSGAVTRIKDWIKENPKLAGTIMKVVAVAGGLMAILGPLAMVLPGLVSGFTMLGGAFSVLCGPAGLAAAAIAGIALSLKAMIDTMKNAKKEMSDFADEAAIFANAAENFELLWIAVREEGGETLEQFNELFKRFGGNWDSIMKTIVRDPKFATLKALLLDIASGVKTVDLKGKELSISLPENIQRVNEAVYRGRLPWIGLGEDIAKFSKMAFVRLLKLKAMAWKSLDLGPAFKPPDFTLGEQKFNTFKEFLDAWLENLKEKWKTSWAAFLDGSRAVVGAMDAVFGQFHENQARRIENEEKQQTDAIESWYERERERIEATIANEEEKVAALEALDEEKARKENALQHKMDKERRKLERARAKSQRASALFSAGINVAEAMTKALTAGPLIGQILYAIVAGLGMAQIGAIAAAPLPALAKGGRIDKAAIVGERGAELFVPDRPGTIIPLQGRSGAGMMPFSFNPTVHIHTKTLDDYTISRAAEKIFAALARERRRFG